MTNDKTMMEKPVIVIDERPDVIPSQAGGETPVITIEDSDNDSLKAGKTNRLGWKKAAVWATLALATCVLVVCGVMAYRYFYNFGVPIGTTPAENILKLKCIDVGSRDSSGVVVSGDSVLGVAMNFYRLNGLKAEIVLSQPDTTDTDIVLCTRCSDFTATGEYLGSLVVGGRVLHTDRSRAGYCGMANNNMVIGVSRSEKVKDYCVERGGSFFRQFVLVSDGVLPARFALHGKVERRALGRTADDCIYLVETRHKETLWDFADALRENGFVDAIYITSGSSHSWYRSADGTLHNIGSVDEPLPESMKHAVPWLVFKKK